MKLSERIRKEFIPGDNILNPNFLGQIELLEADSELLNAFLEIWGSNSDLKECRLAMEKEVKEFKKLFEENK